MLNLLTNLKTWLVASIFVATAASAQLNKSKNCTPVPERGHEISESQGMPAYGAPALIDVRNSWDLYATGSFIYWQASQENMEIGVISENDPEGKITGSPDNPFTTAYVNNMTITSPNFTFRPGFKLGLGAKLNWDGWDAFAEYTQFHSKIATGVSPLPSSTAGTNASRPNGQYLYPIQGNPGTGAQSGYFFQDASQAWMLKMDFLDISLGRGYYLGTKVTVRPFLGARGAWIRQNVTTSFNGSTQYTTAASTDNGYFKATATNFYTSWGVGPRTGFESNWMLGQGLRFIGNGAADILYTRYSLHVQQQAADNSNRYTGSPIDTNYSVSQEIDYLRTHLDLEMGIAWGTYFCQNGYHIDLSATYGYQVFWNQNMFRNFVNYESPGTSFAPNGDLFVHGLTMTARFDF